MIDFCILGSGLSGSTIAKLLSKKYSIEIIDKANGIGGRSSNKKLNKYVSFDHGLQYYSAKDNRFKKFLNQLIKKKILKVWEGNHIDFTFKKKEETRKVIGVNGNNDFFCQVSLSLCVTASFSAQITPPHQRRRCPTILSRSDSSA